jgi:glycine/D-amino acid oxidase-like deaminating enzyme
MPDNLLKNRPIFRSEQINFHFCCSSEVMASPHQVDYIIVGQGLAGSAVAVHLLRAGKKIVVFDRIESNKATLVAAGLFNPVTGKKMTKTWLADTIFPYLNRFYSDVETQTRSTFFHPMPLYRPFISVEEQNDWMARSADEAYKDYVADVFTKPTLPGVNDPFGGLLLKHSGYVDTHSFVQAVREWIKRDGFFQEGDLESDELEVNERGVNYRGWSAQYIIFCTGIRKEKYFGWLPVAPLKGETITVQTSFQAPYIVNRGVYVVPNGVSRFKIGATYDFHDHLNEITARGRGELVEKYQDIVTDPFTVIGQEWGMRPTVPDRRPIVGRHPEYERAAVLNGLGTKGVSLAPYFASILIRSLENGDAINNGADVNRYKSVYWKVRNQV